MAAAELRMPADIFEEMAGVREIVPVQSDTAEGNVNLPEQKTPIDESRLQQAGFIIVSAVPEFKNHILKLAKKLKDMQAPPPPPPKPKGLRNPITVTIHLFESAAEAGARVLTKIWDYLLKGVWFVFKLALKAVWWVLKTLVKWAFKLLWTLGKMLIKIFWKLLKLAMKLLWKLMKWIAKILWKMMKWIWKMIKMLAKAFWKLMMKLFNKIKKKVKKNPKKPDFFRRVGPKNLAPSTPPMKMPKAPKQFAQPDAKMTGMEVKLTEKKAKPFQTNKLSAKKTFSIRTRGKRESIIWRLVKKVFNMFLRMISKLIGKLFSKIIKKLIDTVVRIIVRFVIMQIIGSCIPGLGNAFALAMTAITAIIMIADAVDFIHGLQKMINADGTEEDNDDEPDEPDEDDEDDDKGPKKLTTNELYNKLTEMELKGEENSAQYNQYKKDYMVQLLKQAEAAGNISEVKALKEAMGIPLDKDSGSATVDVKKINDLNLYEFQLDLERRSKETHLKRLEQNKTKLITENEIEEVLVGAEGETDWLQFWRRVMEFIMHKLPNRYSKTTIVTAYGNGLIYAKNFKQTIHKEIPREPYKAYYDARKTLRRAHSLARHTLHCNRIVAREAWRNKMAQDGMLEILRSETTVWGWIKALIFNDYPSIRKTQELVEAHRVNLQEGTAKLRELSDDSNNQQKIKYNHWVDVLIELIKQSRADWENKQKNK